MRTIVAVFLLAGLIGATAAELAAQDGQFFVFRRTCTIAPGQNAAARTFAQEVLELLSAKFPDVQANALEHVLFPLDHMEFVSIHPDLGTYQTRNDALVADEDYQALVQKVAGQVFSGCSDELLRTVP